MASATPAAAALTGSRTAIPALVRRGRPQLTDGVQSGDVTGNQATVWARADRPSRQVVEVATNPSFRDGEQFEGPLVTPRTDLTGRVTLTGLPSGSELYYHIRADEVGHASLSGDPVVGRLRTAPGAGQDLRFVWSGDIAGQGWGVKPDLGGFPMADTLSI